jgi:class 3 adenylate cyclase
MAAALPDARVSLLGSSGEPDLAANAAAMTAFFIEGLTGDRPPLPPRSANASPVSAAAVEPAPHQPSSSTAVILFTDIADSTALTERLGDARFREMSRSLDTGLRAAIRDCGGTTVDAKTLGDGVLATFGAAAPTSSAKMAMSSAAR